MADEDPNLIEDEQDDNLAFLPADHPLLTRLQNRLTR